MKSKSVYTIELSDIEDAVLGVVMTKLGIESIPSSNKPIVEFEVDSKKRLVSASVTIETE